MSETSTRVTTNSDPKAGASSEGNVLLERLRERLTEESFIYRVRSADVIVGK